MLSTLSNYRRLPFLEKGKQNRMAISFTKNGLEHTVEQKRTFLQLSKIGQNRHFSSRCSKVANGFTFLYFLENCNNFSLSCLVGVIKRANYRILFAVFSNNATKGCLCTNAMISSKCYSTPVTEES